MKIYAVGIHHTSKKILAESIVILFILLALSPMVRTENHTNPISSQTDPLNEEKELHLLRGEHYLFINASEDVDEFNIHFAFPPDYNYQAPIYLEIFKIKTFHSVNRRYCESFAG